MSALSTILCFVVIFQIIPQLLCDETTIIIPTDASSKPTTVDIKSSPTNIALAASSTAAALPSAPPSSTTTLPSDITMKPTRAATGGASAGSPSTQPPLIHNSSPEPLPTNKTIKSLMSAKNTTKIEKNSANSIYNHGILASFIVLFVGAIF